MTSNKLFIILLLFLSSCTNKFGTVVTYTWTPDSLLVKKVYNHDSLISLITYQKDAVTKQDSSIYYYHGKPIKVMYYNDNKLAGSYTEYDSLGKARKYICYDSYGTPMFQRTYDGRKHIISEKGSLIGNGVLNKDHLVDDKLVHYSSFIVKPPYSSIIVNNYLLNVNTKDTLKSFDCTEQFDWEHVYFFKIPQPGKYIYYQFTTIDDSIKRKEYRIKDSVITNLVW